MPNILESLPGARDMIREPHRYWIETVDAMRDPLTVIDSEYRIVIGATILAVADVVEAMCSHRPQRPALGVDAALEEITANKGTLYDAAAVEACVRLFRGKGFAFDRSNGEAGRAAN